MVLWAHSSGASYVILSWEFWEQAGIAEDISSLSSGIFYDTVPSGMVVRRLDLVVLYIDRLDKTKQQLYGFALALIAVMTNMRSCH